MNDELFYERLVKTVHCCFTCRSFNDGSCDALQIIKGYLRKRKSGYTRIEWIKRIGSDCEDWI